MIDFHAHFVPQGALEGIARRGRAPSYDPDTRRVTFPSTESRPVSRQLTDLGERRSWNRDRKIDVQVLSPWMELGGDALPASDAVGWCRLLNDAAAVETGADQSFQLLAAVPPDGPTAAEELIRCVTDLGFAGAAIPTQVNGVDLDAAGLHDLFSAADELEAVLFLHPGPTMAADRTSPFFLSNICGNPFETTLAALRLFFSGVTRRHPRIRFLLAHCGGTLPLLAGRAAQASGRVSALAETTVTAAEILACFYYDTVLHDPAALAFAFDRLGTDRIVVGTDVPFPMWVEDPAAHLEAAARLAGLHVSELRDSLRATGMALLGR